MYNCEEPEATRQSRQLFIVNELNINPKSYYGSPRAKALAMTGNGFTLAEVLITLVVIGIIAAITVPMIHANYKKQETVSRLKKFYSSFAQAVKLSEIEQGVPYSDWDYSLDKKDFWMKYLQKYLPVNPQAFELFDVYEEDFGETVSGTTIVHFDKIYSFNDNTGIVNMTVADSGFMNLVVDINGGASPNKVGRDIFLFKLVSKQYMETKPQYKYIDACRGNSVTREELRDYVRLKGQCGVSLIMDDGWEIKEDYPHKI